MARPFRSNWLFGGHDPDSFWDMTFFPIHEGELSVVEALGEDTSPPQDHAESRTVPVLMTAIEHLLDDKSGALKPAEREWRADLKERFLTRWAVHMGKVILVLETKSNDASPVPVVRRDWLEDPAFRQGLFAVQQELAIMGERMPGLDDKVGGPQYVRLNQEKASTVSAVLDSAATSRDLHTIAIPKEKFEYYELVAIPWPWWSSPAALHKWLDDYDQLCADVQALKTAGVKVESGVATFHLDVWAPGETEGWSDALVAFEEALRYMDRADRIPRS